MERLIAVATLAITASLEVATLAPGWAVAHADPPMNDQRFLNALVAGGIGPNCGANPLFVCDASNSAIRLAHNVCAMFQYGSDTGRQIANKDVWSVDRAPGGGPGSRNVFYFIKTAVTFYCPQYLSRVDW